MIIVHHGLGVHKAFNQVVSDVSTYGVFINCADTTISNKKSVMDILIYDITDDLPNLIRDEVYSSYNKGQVLTYGNSDIPLNTIVENNNLEIYVEDNNVTTTQNGTVISTLTSANAYNGQYYYFGLWKESNALYDIQKNYFV